MPRPDNTGRDPAVLRAAPTPVLEACRNTRPTKFTSPGSVDSLNCRNGTSGMSSKPASDIGLDDAAFG